MEHQLLDAPLSEEERKDMADGKGIHVQYLPGTFIPVANKSNDYLIDRQAQREQRSFSGVEGFSMPDASLQESMGPIQDHEAEHLVPTDKAIMMARRKLAEYAASIDEKPELRGLSPETQYVRAASVLLDRTTDATQWAKDALQAGARARAESLRMRKCVFSASSR